MSTFGCRGDAPQRRLQVHSGDSNRGPQGLVVSLPPGAHGSPIFGSSGPKLCPPVGLAPIAVRLAADGVTARGKPVHGSAGSPGRWSGSRSHWAVGAWGVLASGRALVACRRGRGSRDVQSPLDQDPRRSRSASPCPSMFPSLPGAVTTERPPPIQNVSQCVQPTPSRVASTISSSFQHGLNTSGFGSAAHVLSATSTDDAAPGTRPSLPGGSPELAQPNGRLPAGFQRERPPRSRARVPVGVCPLVTWTYQLPLAAAFH